MFNFIVAGVKAIGAIAGSKIVTSAIAAYTLVTGVKAYKTAKALSKSLS